MNAPSDNYAELLEALQRLEREKGEADGMLRILASKLQEAEEDNFDLQSSMSLYETEIKYESDKKESEMQKRLTALESNLAFMSEKLQNAERVKLRAVKEMEQLQQKHIIEAKRRDAERRLMATKRRKQESLQAASQYTRISQDQSQSAQQVTRSSLVPRAEAGVQTELKFGGEKCNVGNYVLREENATLISRLFTGTSRDLLTLLIGTGAEKAGVITEANPDDDQKQPPHECQSFSPSQFVYDSSSNSLNDSLQHSVCGVSFPQSVFSQLAGKASAQAHASISSATIKTNATQNASALNRAQELYDVMGKMLMGDASAVALAPVFIHYLAAETPLAVICSVLRVMYSVMHNSAHFKHFLLMTSSFSDDSPPIAELQRSFSSMEHPRISGLRYTSIDDLLAAQVDNGSVVQSNLMQYSTAEAASEQRQLRLELMSTLCRIVKNSLKDPAVVKSGLCVLCFWLDLGLAHRAPEFKHLLSSNIITPILVAPNSLFTLKALAIRLFSQLLRAPEVIIEVKAEAKNSLLFHQCAKMLSHTGSGISLDEVKNLRILQHHIVKLLLYIITSFPAEGICFVLESTHGPPNDTHEYRSIIYNLIQLLDCETFDARSTSSTRELVSDQDRMKLIEDSFALLGLLFRYVDVRSELGGDDQVHKFLGILYFSSALTNDNGDEDRRNDSIVASARALLAMMNFTAQ